MTHYINYFKLYSYFIEKEGLTRLESLRNIWRTRNLPKEFKEVIFYITEGRYTEGRYSEIGDFQVDGVTIKSLYKDENMKFIQAVFFLDWLRREPGNARAFMASGRYTDPLEIDDEFKNKIAQKLHKIESEKGVTIQTNLVPEDNSEQDIDVDVDSPLIGCMTADSMKSNMNPT